MSVLSNSSRPHGLEPAWLLCLWNFPGKDTGVDCHFCLQGIFLTQGSNLHLLLGRWILYHLATWEIPTFMFMGKQNIHVALFFFFFFFLILLYCHDLEPNPWYLWGLHLLGSTVLNLGKSGLLFFQVFFLFLLLPSPVYIIFFRTPLPFRLAIWFVSQFFVFDFYFPVIFSPMFYFG